MSERERDVLIELRHFTDRALADSRYRQWARPLDVGGRSGSHHSKTLARLYAAGLVDRERRGGYERKSYKYRISEKGREALGAALATA